MPSTRTDISSVHDLDSKATCPLPPNGRVLSGLTRGAFVKPRSEERKRIAASERVLRLRGRLRLARSLRRSYLEQAGRCPVRLHAGVRAQTRRLGASRFA